MAGVLIAPYSLSLRTASGNLGYGVITGAGGNISPDDMGIIVAASLAADAVAQMRFAMPSVIPSGTFVLRSLMVTNDTTSGHVAKYTVSDGGISSGSSASGATLTAETQTTVTLPATPAGKIILTDTTLSTVPTANQILVVGVTFNTSGWTISSLAGANFFAGWT